MVHHSDFNLQPLDLALAVFLSRASREVPKHSPPELDSSSESNKRPGPERSAAARERQQPAGLLSYGFHSPPAYSVKVSTPHGLTSAATFRPRRFHTASTAYSTSSCSEVSSGNHSWGSCPSGVLPHRSAQLIAERDDPHGVGRCLPALGGGRVLRHQLTSRVLRPSTTVAASFRFPYPLGPAPSWALLSGATNPTSRVPPGGHARGPATQSEL